MMALVELQGCSMVLPDPHAMQSATLVEDATSNQGFERRYEQYTRLPSEQGLPPESVTTLERQDSCVSVGSMVDSAEEEESESSENEKTSLEPRSERSSSVVSDASEEGSRDSGIEAEREPDMVVPDQDLMNRIVAQVEFYFSDANIVKDKFLLKHIRRNKEGYVSLKLVSSFKKVKQLTKDWRVVLYSLTKASNFIQVNDQSTKIRRALPLPEIDDTPVTCAVLALKIPLEKPSIDNVSQLFSVCGEIALIRVLRAGGNLPSDVKSYLTKYPILTEANCAWIEFETPEAAKAATQLSSEDGMQVVLIMPESQKKAEKQNQQKVQQKTRKSSLTGQQNKVQFANRKNSFSKYRKDSGESSSSEGTRRLLQRKKAFSLPSSDMNSHLRDISTAAEARRRPKSKSCVEFSAGSPPTSWVQRNLIAAAVASAASTASVSIESRSVTPRVPRTSLGSLPLPNGICRFPKGPDGTRGFAKENRIKKIQEMRS